MTQIYTNEMTRERKEFSTDKKTTVSVSSSRCVSMIISCEDDTYELLSGKQSVGHELASTDGGVAGNHFSICVVT